MPKSSSFMPPVAMMVTKRRLLTPVKVVRTALAGAALRSYTLLASISGEHFPGLRLGRIHLSLDMLVAYNNVHNGTVGAPIPSQMIQAEIDGRQCLLILFTDRTALIAREENDCLGPSAENLFRVLPIVLKLSSRIHMQHRPAEFGVSVSAAQDAAKINITSKHYASFPFLEGPYPNKTVLDDMAILKGQFYDEISAWVKEIDRSPLTALPEGTHTSGIFGQNCKAPDPSVDGLPWALPAAMQHIGFSKEDFKKAQRYCHLAFLHMLQKHAKRLEGGGFIVRVNTAELCQDGTTTSVDIDAFAWSKTEPAKKIQAAMSKEYKSLLKHEKAPGFLFDLVGQATSEREKGVALTRNHPWTIYLGKSETPGSRHDQLSAYALFAG